MKEFQITLWGVRGSSPSPSNNTQYYGGNTSCIQVQIGERLIILDAGTGILNLGKYLSKYKHIDGDIFFSHYHWDHIQGLLFFSPLYQNNTFRFYGDSKNNMSLENIIKNMLCPPYFPITWDMINSNTTFNQISKNQILSLGDEIIIKTTELNHPGGALGYRIEYGSKSCCYITDFEHSDDDQYLISFIKDCDVIIYDAHFSKENYIKGWGHSTWEKGVEFAEEANVKKLILFHHDINRSDDELDIIERKAKEQFKNTLVAREGMKIIL